MKRPFTMYISRIELRNWKNFKEAEATLGNRVFLIGPNASGKSNLLDVFRFLRDIANHQLEKAVNDFRKGVSALRCLAARSYSNIDLEVTLTEGDQNQWRYRLSINQDNVQRPVVKEEVVYRDNEKVVARPNQEDELDRLRLTQTALEQVSENRDFRAMADFFKSI